MVIYIGADHRGFELKQYLIEVLRGAGYTVSDMGSASYNEDDDYPAIAIAVAEKVSVDFERSRGILVCGSGVGVSVVANKFANVRAALVTTPDQAFDSRNEDDANILCLGAGHIDSAAARQILMTWLTTPFSEEPRYARRIAQIKDLETKLFMPRHEERKKPLSWSR